MDGSLQHWLDRNRPPRVQITYDVETLGATVKQEIPFIVGIIGDFAGSAPQGSIADRTFVEIDRDNIKDVMAKLRPALQLAPKPLYQVSRAPDGNTYQPASGTGTTPFAPSLTFGVMEDFGPISIIKQVPELAALMQTRRNLADLMAKLGTNPSLEAGLWTQAAPLALDVAKKGLTDASTALTTAKGKFDEAAQAVLTIETEEKNKDTHDAVAAAQKTVDDFFGDTSNYTQAIKAGTADDATPEQRQAAGAAAWQPAVALRDGMTLLARIVAGYTPSTAAEDPNKPARDAVSAAQGPVDDAVAKAGQAALATASAAAVAVAVAQAA
ncbi:MAG TPA: type VI secretion system contractile sheath small subunit [Longimicrobium sp.]|jgi:type VI secretion system protein ImpB|uniref:type VI secretion system contractile sheath small subunit n=1 Tax=Longimicrobium sp. TaxID=2029185 RepID=UPI002ED98A51